MTGTAAPSGELTPARQPSEAYQHAQQFVSRVHDLCDDPGRRAALRSGLGRPLDRCARMHAVIASHVPGHASEARQRAYYAVAAMIASLPPSARRGAAAASPSAVTDASPRNLGRCLADGVEARRVRESAAEARISLLTRQSLSGLHRHLPATVRLLTSGSGDVDFAQLLLDLSYWETSRRRIGRFWLQSYYRGRMYATEKAAAQADDESQQLPQAAPENH
ncbi:type I-E CRISPR-associated protein Cse2/CasB [Streptomyces sp. Ru87]|uniref:type I-E CRISPR-associated protein Cse2/CasB n=1 Tax=Streptomyces sp. Ru87 TaxID=2044307 RepID=UPI0015D51E6F|nr:type I-E CRISPR-associated protein Cse2/CasB [Streptomyces sp. Ru87]